MNYKLLIDSNEFISAFDSNEFISAFDSNEFDKSNSYLGI